MKRAYLYVCLLTLGLTGIVSLTPASNFAQDTTAISQLNATGPADDAQEARTFVGQIMQANGKYVLQDVASKDTLLLDDQEKAKEFDGKSVKVKGTLDAASKTIHVIDIQAA